MKKLPKRVRAGMWIAFAGFVSTVCTLFLAEIDSFASLSGETKTVVYILLTAVVSQVTKHLNTKKNGITPRNQ